MIDNCIHGVTGRESVGASLTVGQKGPKGYPVERDRFFLKEPRERDGVKHPHRDFEFFNRQPPEKRRVIRGVIVHESWDDAVRQGYYCQAAKGLAGTPDGRPVCKGDGKRAERWNAERREYMSIPCPGEGCEYRQPVGKHRPPCLPRTRLAFRLDWSGTPAEGKAPTPVTQFSSGGWHTFSSVLGLRESLSKAAAAMGIDPSAVSPFGLRFSLTLSEKTNKEQRSRYPVVDAALECSAADHIMGVLGRATEARAMVASLADSSPRELIEATADYDPRVVVGDGDA